MNKTFDDVYNQFLTYAHSCTFADLSDDELLGELRKFLERALADFRFPHCSLEYTEKVEETEDPETHEITSSITYIFTDKDFGQREINVLIAYMKKYYIEWILSREQNFQQIYYDSDTKTFSQGNIIQQLNTAYKTAIKEANDVNYDYSRMDGKTRSPLIGKVNV